MRPSYGHCCWHTFEASGHRCPDGKMLNMTRADLIAAIASRFPTLTVKDADIAVKEILDAIGRAMAQGDRVEIRGFGSFRLNYHPARAGRNPRTGVAVPVPEKYVPHFTAGNRWQGTAGARRGVSQGRTASAGRLMHTLGRLNAAGAKPVRSRFARRLG